MVALKPRVVEDLAAARERRAAVMLSAATMTTASPIMRFIR
jgi:hypothetical protein